MIRLKRLLLATDFSDCSAHALRYACEFADVFAAELHLLHVIEPPAVSYSEFGVGYTGTPDYSSDWTTAAEQQLLSLPSATWQAKLSIVRSVVVGRPFVETVRYAEEQEIDLLVIGTHGRGAIAQMLLGGTAEKIVRKSPCPVLTVGPGGHEFVKP